MDIALALGGGGIRGVAHLGVLHALEQEGFKIRAVAGTSAGGMVAAVYAAGWRPKQIIEVFRDVNQEQIFSFGGSQHLFSNHSILGLQVITEMLNHFLEDQSFEDLQIPCAVTAVDMETLQEVILQEGSVLEAVLATIAIPGVFPPLKRGDTHLVDGGVLDPVPVQTARTLAPALPVVAVSISPPPETWDELRTMDQVINTPMLGALSNTGVGQAFDFSVRSIEIMNHLLAQQRLKVEQPAVVIQPDVAHIGLLEQVDVLETISLGERAVQKARPELEQFGDLS
jgi:NTE family protein